MGMSRTLLLLVMLVAAPANAQSRNVLLIISDDQGLDLGAWWSAQAWTVIVVSILRADMPDDPDLSVRNAAFERLSEQVELHDDVLPRVILARGFNFDDKRVLLVGLAGQIAVHRHEAH